MIFQNLKVFSIYFNSILKSDNDRRIQRKKLSQPYSCVVIAEPGPSALPSNYHKLENLFKPPLDLLFRGSFNQVKADLFNNHRINLFYKTVYIENVLIVVWNTWMA